MSWTSHIIYMNLNHQCSPIWSWYSPIYPHLCILMIPVRWHWYGKVTLADRMKPNRCSPVYLKSPGQELPCAVCFNIYLFQYSVINDNFFFGKRDGVISHVTICELKIVITDGNKSIELIELMTDGSRVESLASEVLKSIRLHQLQLTWTRETFCFARFRHC